MKTNGAKKRWGKMSAAELAEATKEFDQPLPASRYKPASKADRERFERALRAGESVKEAIETLGVDAQLLEKAAVYAKKKNLTICQVLERGLRRELAVTD